MKEQGHLLLKDAEGCTGMMKPFRNGEGSGGNLSLCHLPQYPAQLAVVGGGWSNDAQWCKFSGWFCGLGLEDKRRQCYRFYGNRFIFFMSVIDLQDYCQFLLKQLLGATVFPDNDSFMVYISPVYIWKEIISFCPQDTEDYNRKYFYQLVVFDIFQSHDRLYQQK